MAASSSSMENCSTSNPSPAGPPAPPAEIPSNLTLPQSIAIDVNKISAEGAAGLLLAQVAPGGEFSDVITEGPAINDFAFGLIDGVFLRLASLIQAPVSPDITQFETTVTDGDETVTFKVDFADIDLDNDGVKEGCTGSTCPVAGAVGECPKQAEVPDLRPVCFRMWFKQKDSDFTKFMAGAIDRLLIPDDPATPENEFNRGAARMRANFIDPAFPDDFLLMAADYDHSQAPNESTEVFLSSPPLFGQPGDVKVHIDLLQEAFADTLRKTIRATNFNDLEGDQDPTIRYVGRFREDADFWSGSFEQTHIEGEADVSVEDICAFIPTGEEASPPENPRANCLDLGIDVNGIGFLAPLTPEDVSLPADFPSLPTF
jgi:hypothetical protein